MSLNGRLSESLSAYEVDLSHYDYVIPPCPRQESSGESSYSSLHSTRHTYELTLPFATSFRVSKTNRFYSGTLENLSHASDEDLRSSLMTARDLLSNSYNFEDEERTNKAKSKSLRLAFNGLKTNSDAQNSTITSNLNVSRKVAFNCAQVNSLDYASLVSTTPETSEKNSMNNPLRSSTEWRKTAVQNVYKDLSSPGEAMPVNTRNTVSSLSPKTEHFTTNSTIQKRKEQYENCVSLSSKLSPEDHDFNLWSRDPRNAIQNGTDDELSESNPRGFTSNILLAKQEWENDSSRLTPLDTQLDLERENDHGRERSKTSQFLRHVPPAQSPKTRLQRQYYQVHVLGELKDFLPILSELKNDEITSSMSRDSVSILSASSDISEHIYRESSGGKDGQQNEDKCLDQHESNSVGTGDPAELEWRCNYDDLVKELKHKTKDKQSRQISAQTESETTSL